MIRPPEAGRRARLCHSYIWPPFKVNVTFKKGRVQGLRNAPRVICSKIRQWETAFETLTWGRRPSGRWSSPWCGRVSCAPEHCGGRACPANRQPPCNGKSRSRLLKTTVVVEVVFRVLKQLHSGRHNCSGWLHPPLQSAHLPKKNRQAAIVIDYITGTDADSTALKVENYDSLVPFLVAGVYVDIPLVVRHDSGAEAVDVNGDRENRRWVVGTRQQWSAVLCVQQTRTMWCWKFVELTGEESKCWTEDFNCIASPKILRKIALLVF